LFEPYHIYYNENQKRALFNYLSNNKPFITIDDLEYFFGTDENENDIDFYEKMHNDIITFLNDNFKNPEDAFKYFHNEKYNNNYMNNANTYITKKEFFNAISNLFPDKYPTNTISFYYSKYFQNKPQISYSEFVYIYYNTYNFNSQYSKSLNEPSKILIFPKNILKALNPPFQQKKINY
jgi:hypothetical protein